MSDVRCKSDVGFIMDSSGSVGTRWEDEKTFVKRIAQTINLSLDHGHGAVTVFSNDATLNIKFSDYYTYSDPSPAVDSFEEAVDTLSFLAGGTRIDRGLEVAYEQMFNETNGMRADATKYLILITDGQQAGLDYADWGNRFSNANIRVIVIGVGLVNQDDLLNLVAVDSDLRLADNFDELLNDTFIGNVELCDGRQSQK